METIAECQSFSDFQSLRDAVEAALGGPVSIISSKTVEQANKELGDGEVKFPASLQFKNVRLGCKQFNYKTEGKNTRATHSPVKIQCPAHVIAAACNELGLLIIKQVSFEHNHPISPPSSAEKHPLLPTLADDDHPVSHVGLTITVSCKDDRSDRVNKALVSGSSELKSQLLSGGQIEQSEDDEDGDVEKDEDGDVGGETDNSDDEEDDDDDDNDDDGDEEEMDSSEPSSTVKKNSSKTSKKHKITVSKYQKYSPEAMEKAYKAIKAQRMSVHLASQKYGIPKSTLYDRINDRSAYNLGGKPNRFKTKILDVDTEHQMIDHIKHMESIGQALSQSEILSLATKLAQTAGTISKSRTLSRGWYKAFLGRWPGIKKLPEHVSKLYGDISVFSRPKSKQEYFLTVQSLMDKCKLHNKPHLIYKLDEIIFMLNRKSLVSATQPQRRSLVVEGSASVSTVLLCGNALGYSLPPYFIMKRKKTISTQGSMEGSSFKIGDSGLVTSTVLKDYLSNHFIPNMVKRDEEHILLLFEDHGNTVTPAIAEWAQQKGVILYTLPALYSDPTHSLEFGCYFPFSQAFSSVCSEYLLTTTKVNVCDLAELVYMAMLKSMTMKNLKASFAQAGIFPFDKSRKELLLAKNLIDTGCRQRNSKNSTRGRKKTKIP